MTNEMPSEESLQDAAACWCDKETSMIEMDTRLAIAFAKRLDKLKLDLVVANKMAVASHNDLLSHANNLSEELSWMITRLNRHQIHSGDSTINYCADCEASAKAERVLNIFREFKGEK